MRQWGEECGVVGIWNLENAAKFSYLGLYAMQHRGQESAGIVSLDNGKHWSHKALGLVGEVFNDKILDGLKGRTTIGHVRYSTSGVNQLSNAQPLCADLLNGPVAVAHNGNLVNAQSLKKALKEQGAIFQGTTDTEAILHLISRTKTDQFWTALKEVLPQLEGAFSLVFLTHDALYAARDTFGFRPLVLGKKKNDQGEDALIVASETCALDLMGAEFVREIAPGEMIKIDAKGLVTESFKKPTRSAMCIFEHIYFSRPDSVVFGQSVYAARKQFGRWLSKEKPVDADIIVPVPDSGIPAALGYSVESKIPFELGIIRNHYIGRTFIHPESSTRSSGVKIKLNPQASILKGKRVVLVDDSLVRGTTSQMIVRLVRAAGAKEVHVRIASPPTISPCFYGVDTPQKSQLLAAHYSADEICKFIEADTLSYLSLEGMFEAIKVDSKNFCAACFDGKYPTQLEDDLLKSLEAGRPR